MKISFIKNSPFLLCLVIFISCHKEKQVTYDIVIENARVIDPETSTDSILQVGIIGDKIEAVTAKKIFGKTTINGSGKVLSPGFIDLHAHGQTYKENYYQAFDGVTTALELEVGVDTLAQWLQFKKGHSLLNYGASACQLAYRNKILRKKSQSKKAIYDELSTDSVSEKKLNKKDFPELKKLLSKALSEGAIGIGIPVGYTPHASAEEISYVYTLAGTWKVPVFSHIREGGPIAFQQAIADAILNKTTLHICHINSMARKDIEFCLELVEKSQSLGFPISTELYPYTAGNTEISSAIFDTGWEERLGCSYSDLQWVATGERLTKEKFNQYRKSGGSVIVHMLQESWIDLAITSPITMIASDGGDYSKYGHPRSSGTYCKVIRKYVRENKILDLPTAIKKMTLMPAKVLENAVPEMKMRGRIQKGCYADLLLFNPQTVQDHSTYTQGFVKSSGISDVWINGKHLISNGKMIKNIYPGTAIKGISPVN